MRAPTSPDDIDLGSVFGAARRAVPRAMLVAAILGGATAGLFSIMSPRYAAQATVEMVGRSTVNPLNPGAMTEVRSDPDREAVGTHARKMMSNDVTLPLIRELDLLARPEFNEALTPTDTFGRALRWIGIGGPKANETDEDRVLGAYRQAMRVAQIRETRSIQIDFTAPDPQLAARGANRLAEMYRDSLTTTRQDETAELRAKLKVEVDRLTKEVSEADHQVTQFRGQRDLFRGGQASTPLRDQQLALLTEDLTRLTTARIEAQTRAATAREQMQRDTAEANPDVQKSQVIPRLVDQRVRLERQISELSATLLPAHPRMRQLQGDLSTLKRQISDEIRKVVDSLERDAKINADREAGVQRRIADLKATMTTAAPDDARLKGLEDIARAKRAEFERIQQAYQKAVSTEQTGDAPVEVKIVQRAIASNEKVWPKMWLAGLVGLGAFLLTLFVTITRALIQGPDGGGRRTRTSTAPDHPQTLKAQPVMAPPARTARAPARASTAAPLSDRAAPPTASPMAGIAASLVERARTQGATRVLVAGARPGIDATAVALDLGTAVTRLDQRAVLVEWAAAQTMLSDRTGAASGPGLAELLRGDVAHEDAIQKLAGSDLEVVTAGDGRTRDVALYDADRANMVLDSFDESYALVIVVAAHQAARDVFEAIQGRFDVGIVVGDQDSSNTATFLGFDVPDLVVHTVTPPPQPSTPRRSTQRVAKIAETTA
jgi:uncharacterized protein involved in exopolysaccharide biosynthesis/Mrp family chromosome partitioning ATPase